MANDRCKCIRASNSVAIRWLPGYCAPTEPGSGDCSIGDRGLWKLSPINRSSWDTAMLTCSWLCQQCPRCKVISVSLRRSRCSWFAQCSRLLSDTPGFRTIGARVTHANPQATSSVAVDADHYALSRLRPPALLDFDVFIVSSPHFWQNLPHIVQGFFSHLKPLGSRGLLVTRHATFCESAVGLYGIPCAVSNHYKVDDYLSKEKWQVIRHFLWYEKPVIAAGADVRLLRPASWLLSLSGAVDAAFEGLVQHDRIAEFTPDVIVAFPTPNMRAFTDKMIASIRFSESTERLLGLTAADVNFDRSTESTENLTRINTTFWGMKLTGPAEQDLLFDMFVSVLYGSPHYDRKKFVARDILEAAANQPVRRKGEVAVCSLRTTAADSDAAAWCVGENSAIHGAAEQSAHDSHVFSSLQVLRLGESECDIGIPLHHEARKLLGPHPLSVFQGAPA
eukprot:CAMPEP_0119329910 /NCGR_PEP_ID=MMETSP1333-20130426/77000_1 /TAXON_ID=418940 /ORGANISM="Scyphosphaera apsteinii, Strain RCC1455" /LENGTH=449 /DNA_ID=CAMNT_0007339153 /DNA_START=364 /DNA_END=1712 /DNA_ORIENTATION=-